MEFESKQPTRLRVQAALPDQFLFQIGAYLQTCAHIEVAACTLICTVEGLQLDTQQWWDRFHPLRKKRTSVLIDELETSVGKLHEPLAKTFNDFVAWIRDYSTNRHIAAHGAFFCLPKDGQFRVEYTRQKKSGAIVQYERERSEIDSVLVKTVLEDADRILRTLEETIANIRQGTIPISADTN